MLPRSPSLRLSDFNSIKVRLKLGAVKDGISSLLFQFHKGTIKTSPPCITISTSSNFNSIKVRLKLQGRAALLNAQNLFQFHKGTIKTVVSDVDFAFALISIP